MLERPYSSGVQGYMPGFDKAPPWSLQLAWQECKYSTLALAYTVTAGPVFAGTRTLELIGVDEKETKPGLTGNGITSPADKIKKAMEEHFEPLWPSILNGLECLNFGFWDQEVIWDRVDGLTLPTRFKDLLPWEPTLLYDKFGDFAGIRYNQQDRAPEYVLHHVHQRHKGQLHGYPRTENTREPWWRAIQSDFNGDRLEKKASGISMMVLIDPHYDHKDSSGVKKTGAEIAQVVFNNLSTGGSAAMSRYTFSKDAIEKNPALADHKPVEVEAFDWGTSAQSMLAQTARMDAIDTRIMRAYYRPEREAMQGLHGTMAEAGVHGQVGMTDSERCHSERVADFNTQTWATVLRTNGLPPMRWKATPLADPEKHFLQEYANNILKNPIASAEAAGRTNIPALLKRVEIPIDDTYRPLPQLPTAPVSSGTNGNRMAGMVR